MAMQCCDLIDLKQRNIDQGLILVASHFEQLQPLLLPLSAAIQKACHASTQVTRHLGAALPAGNTVLAARQASLTGCPGE